MSPLTLKDHLLSPILPSTQYCALVSLTAASSVPYHNVSCLSFLARPFVFVIIIRKVISVFTIK